MKKTQTFRVIAATALLVGGITNLDAKGTKKTHVSKKEPVKGKLNHDEAIKKIRVALQAGKLSREEAAKEIAAVKKEFGNKKKPDPKSKYDTTVKKIDYDAKLKTAEKEIAALKKELRSKKKGKSKRTKSKRK